MSREKEREEIDLEYCDNDSNEPLISYADNERDRERDRDREGHSETSSYSNTLSCDQKKILGFFSVSSSNYAIFRLVCDILGILTFTASIAQRKPRYLFFICQYLFWSYCSAPLWQTYQLFDIKTKEIISSSYGCLICFFMSSFYGLLTDKFDFRPLKSSDPRYIPFSVYNEIYMITHPNQELNPNFPEDIKSFGLARTFLLIYSSSAKASLNLVIFYNAYSIFQSESDFFSTCIALIALVIAISDLRIYILTSIFGSLFNIYMVILTVSFFIPMPSFMLDPTQNNPLFIILFYYWKLVVQCT
jgi:hypothetical protein